MKRRPAFVGRRLWMIPLMKDDRDFDCDLGNAPLTHGPLSGASAAYQRPLQFNPKAIPYRVRGRLCAKLQEGMRRRYCLLPKSVLHRESVPILKCCHLFTSSPPTVHARCIAAPDETRDSAQRCWTVETFYKEKTSCARKKRTRSRMKSYRQR